MKTTKPKIAAFFLRVLLALGGVAGSSAGFSQIQSVANPSIGYIFDFEDLPRGLSIPVEAKRLTIKTSRQVTQERLTDVTTTANVEPIEIQVPIDATRRTTLAEKLAQPGRAKDLRIYLERKRVQATANGANNATQSAHFFKATLDAEVLELVDLDELAQIYASTHHRLMVPTTPLRRRNGQLGKALLRQMAPFFSARELNTIRDLMNKRSTLNLDRILLPSFARRTVGLYTKYRGPNCFQAALAFQDPALPWRPDVNSKLEPGYHRAMINNDELWWALNRFFVEVDPREEDLQYGDVLVFLDVADTKKPLYYRWIKHASTYLFGEYVFSKGSNSPNSPYSVKTLREEWDTWAKRTSQMGLKVYRRLPSSQQDLADSTEYRLFPSIKLR